MGEWQLTEGLVQSSGDQLVPAPMLAGVSLHTIARRLGNEEELRGGNFEIYDKFSLLNKKLMIAKASI